MNLRKNVRRYALFVAGLVILGTIVMIGANHFLSSEQGLDQRPVLIVKPKSFRLEVMERGVIRPAKITPIKSTIAGNQAKLIWVLPEGQQVTKGLLIARFDTKPLMDELQKAEQELIDAQAQVAVEIKALELLDESGQSKEDEARRELEIARIKADDFKNGSGPLERKKKELAVAEAERNVRIRLQEHEDLKPLLENGHITQREYEKAENDLLHAREELQIAQAALANFEKYEWPKIIREAEVIEEAARIKLERVRRTNELERQQQNSKIEKFRRNLTLKTQEVTKAKQEVAACDVYAPDAGILLYSELPSPNGKRKVQIGDSVWQGQTFLEIPDTNDLVVEINIREIDVTKLAPGMTTEISLDAHPEKVFSGSLIAVDALAQQDEQNDAIRRFFATVRFADPSTAVRVGMSATVHIIYQELDQVLAVPLHAISFDNGRPVVEKIVQGVATITPVSLGAIGLEWAQILDGLQENDQIRAGSI